MSSLVEQERTYYQGDVARGKNSEQGKYKLQALLNKAAPT